MRRLLDSGENVNAYTPETSRSAVVPENTSWEVQQARVVQEMTDPSVRRVSVSRMRNDNKEEQRGKLLLGRTSLAFVLRGDESLVFSHSYLCIASYAIEKDELIYGLSAKGDLRTYRFFLDEPLTAHEIDLRMADAIAAANAKDGGRKGGKTRSRSGSVSVEKVGRGSATPGDDLSPVEIAGKRHIIKLLGSDKQKFRCIAFLNVSGFVVLDVSRGMLRVFDWESISRPEKHKDKRGAPKGRITFDYFRALVEGKEAFDCNLFAITLFVKPPDEFFLDFEKTRLAQKPQPLPDLPHHYP